MQTQIVKIENPLPVNELLKRADQGDAECQYWAGIRYLQAEGVAKDFAKAYRYCTAAAAQGHRRAQAFLGYCLCHGIAVPAQLRLSVKWYRLSAQQGYAPAQYSLGVFYLNGRGVKKNTRLGLHWLGKAAAQGDAEAQLKLGHIYHYGIQVEEDAGLAYSYYLAAADQGSAEAQYQVAKLLGQGLGVAENQLEAFAWLDRSAAAEYGPAVETRRRFEEFVVFDPARHDLGSLPVDHPVPVRQRTLGLMEFAGRVCLQQIAKDILLYVSANPECAQLAHRDVALLLNAARHRGEVLLPIFGSA